MRVAVQVRTVERGSWRWQDAFRVQLVQCPVGESPDCRRRSHTLVSVIAKKTAHPRQYLEMAEMKANELTAEMKR